MKMEFNFFSLLSKKNTRLWALGISLSTFLAIAIADFTNGGFEAGNLTGWTTSTYLNNTGVTVASPVENTQRSALNLSTGGTNYTSVVTGSGPESLTDAQVGSGGTLRIPLFGNSAARVNYTLTNSRNANGLTQQMTVTTADIDPADNKPHVRLVVAPVVEKATHTAAEQPYYFVRVRNISKGTTLFSTFKYSNQPGVPWKDSPSGLHQYTDWQLIDVSPGPGALDVGDVVEVEIIASRCQPTGHDGYVYVDGVGSFIPGLTVVGSGPEAANDDSDFNYTYNYRNGSSDAVSNATVTITLPTGVTFQSVSAAGATCSTPSIGSAGTISCNFGTVPKDATGSFSVTVHVNSGVTGYISHGDYNIDSDQTSSLIGPLVMTQVTSGVTYADLGVDLTDGVAAVGWGQSLQLTLTVTNNGPADVTGGTVTYTVPAELTGVTWTCSAGGAASCSASGSGSISDSVNIPSGDSVVYLIAATVVSGTGTSSVTNQASAAVPVGVTDNVSTNNLAVDEDEIGTLVNLTAEKNVAAGGTITSAPAAISCNASCLSETAPFLDGASVTLSAVAATNFVFNGWNGGGCSGTAGCTLTLSGDVTITASFDCTTGYYGASCTSQCPGSGNCSGHGTCDDGVAGAGSCSCDPGYSGADCSTYNPDTDGDGVNDGSDNCPLVSNSSQTDTDGDGTGDACDTDDDGDAVLDGSDNCPLVANASQTDTDGDGTGDACDTDDDGDAVLDGSDNCPLVANASQTDTDSDGTGDACDTDDDGDAVLDGSDNCPLVANASQTDTDSDGTGDACDTDDDGDTVIDGSDNCPLVANASQTDTDSDGTGDACDTDDDGDTVIDGSDNCPLVANASQTDNDSDGTGDDCDADDDGDGINDGSDNCPLVANSSQTDTDGDGTGDACDTDDDGDGIPDSTETTNDRDGDGIPNSLDLDSDGDGIPDSIESTPDQDSDGIPNYLDKDSDGDFISDTIERAGSDDFTPPSGIDADQNGLDDAFEPGGISPDPVDLDEDSDPDYLDVDSDNDGTSDSDEAFDNDNDGQPDTSPSGNDTDGDGIDDGMEQYDDPSSLPGYWRDSSNGENSCTSVPLTAKVNAAIKSAEAMNARAIQFSRKAEACGSVNLYQLRSDAAKNLRQFKSAINKRIGASTLSCPAYVCKTISTKPTKNKLRENLNNLYQRSLLAKLAAMQACPRTEPEDPTNNRKRSRDYLTDALQSLGKVPGSLTSCD
jgi:uncharacterized repeat protein (TIGR01451 family)